MKNLTKLTDKELMTEIIAHDKYILHILSAPNLEKYDEVVLSLGDIYIAKHKLIRELYRRKESYG